MLFGHAILFVALVAFPGFWTAVAPLTTVELTREGSVVRADIRPRMWFIVPYRHVVVPEVLSIDDRIVAGSGGERELRPGGSSSDQVPSENQAFLTIEGKDVRGKIEVSPVNVVEVRRKVQAFFEDSTQAHLRIVVVANWKFSVFAGGFLSLLTFLYIYMMASELIRTLFRRGRKEADPAS